MALEGEKCMTKRQQQYFNSMTELTYLKRVKANINLALVMIRRSFEEKSRSEMVDTLKFAEDDLMCALECYKNATNKRRVKGKCQKRER